MSSTHDLKYLCRKQLRNNYACNLGNEQMNANRSDLRDI